LLNKIWHEDFLRYRSSVICVLQGAATSWAAAVDGSNTIHIRWPKNIHIAAQEKPLNQKFLNKNLVLAKLKDYNRP